MFNQVLERLAAHVEERPASVAMPVPEIAPFAANAPFAATSTRRRYRRWSVNLSAEVVDGDAAYACAVYDVSPGGARLQMARASDLEVGRLVLFDLEGYGVIPAEVRHAEDGFLGLRFTHDAQDEVEFARDLVTTRPPRRRARQAVSAAATLRAAASELPCVVSNISRTGAAVQMDEARHLEAGNEVTLKLAGHTPMQALVRYIDGNLVGLRLIDLYDGA